jgi:dihydrofolate reductase
MKLTLMMAMTADGFIAKSSGHFPDWTGKADKQLFVSVTKRAGAVIMGSKTFDTIGAPLHKRLNVIVSRNKNRISRWNNLIYTHQDPEEILNDLTERGFSEAILAGGATINSLFAAKNLIDEILVTVCPRIFGQGLSLFSTPIDMKLDLLEHSLLEDHTMLMRYSVKRE